MAKHILTAVEVKNAKGPADGGPKYHKDGAGLFLQVSPTRSKSWVFRRKDPETGKTPEVGIGSYPEIGLGKAREIAGEIWNLTCAGIPAKDARDQAKAVYQTEVIEEAGLPAPGVWTFDMAAKEFIDTRIAPDARSVKHVQQWRNTLKQYASPHIGKMPLDDIELKHVLAVLKPIWYTKRETGKRVRQRIERIIGWAQIMGHRSSGQNPAQWENYLDNLLPSPYKNREVKHMPSMPYPDLPGFLAKLRGKGGMGARAL